MSQKNDSAAASLSRVVDEGTRLAAALSRQAERAAAEPVGYSLTPAALAATGSGQS